MHIALHSLEKGGEYLKCNIKRGGGRSIKEWGRKGSDIGSIKWGWDGRRKSRDEGWLRMRTRMSIEVACLCFQVVCVSIVRILSVYWTPRLGDIIARMEKYRRYWFLCSARLTRSFSLKNALEAREFIIQIQIWSQHYIFKPMQKADFGSRGCAWFVEYLLFFHLTSLSTKPLTIIIFFSTWICLIKLVCDVVYSKLLLISRVDILLPACPSFLSCSNQLRTR